MNKQNIPSTILAAARVYMAKGDARFYLNGVQFDRAKSRIIATNGHTLIVIPFNFKANGGEDWPDKSNYILPTGNLGKMCTLNRDGLLVAYRDDRCTVELCRHRLLEQDAEPYPDADRVVPSDYLDYTGAKFAASSTYLAYLEKAFGKQCGMRFYAKDGASPVVVTPDLPENHPLAGARVVIMPMRW